MPTTFLARLLAAPALTLALSSAAIGAQWVLDPAASTLTVSGTQTGAGFTGRFPAFAAEIVFDPDNLAESRIAVTVETGAFASGASDRDALAIGDEWFSSAAFPTARFESEEIVMAADGSYVANGVLTVREAAVAVALPFRLAIEGDRAVAEGELPLDRLAFGIGTGDWEDPEVVGTEVVVRFRIEAERQ